MLQDLTERSQSPPTVWFCLVFSVAFLCVNLTICSSLSAYVNMGFFFSPQLFRRVAAALPGMDTTQDKSREDSILCVRVCVCGARQRKLSDAYTLEDLFAILLGGTGNLFQHS